MCDLLIIRFSCLILYFKFVFLQKLLIKYLFIFMGQITFIPVGGLANRMRAIASALTLAQRTNSNLDIVWYKDHALYASFYSLFEPISYNVSLRDASWLDSCLLDRPRKRNFYIPRLFQMIAFDDCLYERSFYSLVKNAFDFDNWVYGKNKVYMAQGGLSVAGRCRCLTKDSNTSIEKEGYIPYSLQA